MRTIAIVNQKGGCGKTTTAVNLAGSLVSDGAQVLVVDIDPQAHATLALGIDPDKIEEHLYDVLAEPEGEMRIEDILIDISPGLALAPSGIVLSALEQKLASEQAEGRTHRLATAIEQMRRAFDFVLIDCPPNVGLLTFNALRAASEVLVPLETSTFAIHGVQKLLETIALLAERLDHELEVRILPTLYDGRTRYARETLAEIRSMFKDMCFDTVIRSNIKLREAAKRGVPIGQIARSANGTLDYASLSLEIRAADLDLAAAAAEREIVIHYRDAEASDVRIAGDFNGWVPDKNVESRVEFDGSTAVWTKILHLAPGTYSYRYLVDGRWCEDPANPPARPGGLGERSSVLVVR